MWWAWIAVVIVIGIVWFLIWVFRDVVKARGVENPSVVIMGARWASSPIDRFGKFVDCGLHRYNAKCSACGWRTRDMYDFRVGTEVKAHKCPTLDSLTENPPTWEV